MGGSGIYASKEGFLLSQQALDLFSGAGVGPYAGLKLCDDLDRRRFFAAGIGPLAGGNLGDRRLLPGRAALCAAFAGPDADLVVVLKFLHFDRLDGLDAGIGPYAGLHLGRCGRRV